MTDNKKSTIYALLAILFWSTVATVFKITLKYIDPFNLVFYTSLVSTIVLFPFWYFKISKNPDLSIFQNFSKSLVPGLLNPALYYIVLFSAYFYVDAQVAQPLNYTWPIVFSVFSVLFLNEKFKMKFFISLILGFIGVLIITTKASPISVSGMQLKGVLLALASAFIWSIYWVLNVRDKRLDQEKLFFNFLIGTFFIFMFLVITNSLKLPSSKALVGIVYIGLFEMGLSFMVWLKALKYSDSKMKLSNLIFFSPFISLIFISFFLNEKIHFTTIIGLVLIIIATMLQRINLK